MKKIHILILLLSLSSIFSACKKDKTEPSELSKLPPATQSGANTFGCLINGKAWVAQRNDCSILCDKSFKIYYDGNYGGYVGITALKIDIKNNIDEQINIVFDSSNFKTSHSLTILNQYTTASFRNYSYSGSCNSYVHYFDSTAIHMGSIILNRYDLQNGIFSGTFDFTISKPGCPTLNVTEGRFDKKL